MKSQLLVLFATVTLATPGLGATDTRKSVLDVSKAKSEVEFLAIGNPSALKIHGRAKDGDKKAVTGNLTLDNGNVSGKVDVQIESFDTGIAMRNHHMNEKYLESAKFPQSEFTLTELKIPTNGDIKVSAVPFKGTLNLHGVSKPVSGLADVKKSGKDVSLKFEFKLSTDDYGITTPSFMGITMTREVTVDVNFEGPVS